MDKRINLTRKQYIITASLLFGMFFGAGNLIFPIHLGQMAGTNWLPAAIGFFGFRNLFAIIIDFINQHD